MLAIGVKLQSSHRYRRIYIAGLNQSTSSRGFTDFGVRWISLKFSCGEVKGSNTHARGGGFLKLVYPETQAIADNPVLLVQLTYGQLTQLNLTNVAAPHRLG